MAHASEQLIGRNDHPKIRNVLFCCIFVVLISWFQSIEMEALLIVLLPILVYSANIAAVFFGLLYLLNWVLCPPNEEKDVEGTRYDERVQLPDINRSEYSGNLIC